MVSALLANMKVVPSSHTSTHNNITNTNSSSNITSTTSNIMNNSNNDMIKKRLLICAPSNTAIDEILLRLSQGIYDHHGKFIF